MYISCKVPTILSPAHEPGSAQAAHDCHFAYTKTNIVPIAGETHRISFSWLAEGEPAMVVKWLAAQPPVLTSAADEPASPAPQVIVFSYGAHNAKYPTERYQLAIANVSRLLEPWLTVFHETPLAKENYVHPETGAVLNVGWNTRITEMNRILHESVIARYQGRGCVVRSQGLSARHSDMLIDGVHYNDTFTRWIVEADSQCFAQLLGEEGW